MDPLGRLSNDGKWRAFSILKLQPRHFWKRRTQAGAGGSRLLLSSDGRSHQRLDFPRRRWRRPRLLFFRGTYSRLIHAISCRLPPRDRPVTRRWVPSLTSGRGGGGLAARRAPHGACVLCYGCCCARQWASAVSLCAAPMLGNLPSSRVSSSLSAGNDAGLNQPGPVLMHGNLWSSSRRCRLRWLRPLPSSWLPFSSLDQWSHRPLTMQGTLSLSRLQRRTRRLLRLCWLLLRWIRG